MDDNIFYFLPQDQLQCLIDALLRDGYECIGPQIRDNTIVYESINSIAQLPWGIRDIQSPGQYHLEQTDEKKAFLFANGPQAIKPILFKPTETVWSVVRDESNKLIFKPAHPSEKPQAIFGARACDLAAMSIQDKVFLKSEHIDLRYQKRREALFIVAVNCSYASQNCFCVSANTGPKISHSFDIALTEINQGYLLELGSERGEAMLSSLSYKIAKLNQVKEANICIERAETMQTKRIPFDNSYQLREFLFNHLDHPQWQKVAETCLSCGNCTQVCPTCFCHSEKDDANLDGVSSEHKREWDSCFTAGHSYLSGKSLRDETSKQYRQWLTHKVGSWFDQFDESGCVGCGRCISWCPVGIDLTEELAIMTGESNTRSNSSK